MDITKSKTFMDLIILEMFFNTNQSYYFFMAYYQNFYPIGM